MKRIPLHSLVILVGPACGGKSRAASAFDLHEPVRADDIRFEISGDYQRTDINDIVFREVHHRTALKLELGERAVVDATNLRRKDRMGLAEIGLRLGVPIYYIVCDRPLEDKLEAAKRSWRKDAVAIVQRHHQIFLNNERELLRGDGVANVIDTRVEAFEPVKRIQSRDILAQIKQRGYRGILAVGDVHGMIEPLKSATEWATSRGLFVVFLGDILDYGPNSLDCVDHVYDVVTRGRGVSVMGNHERKIERWLEQVRYNDVRLRLSDGNKVTTKQISALSPEARKRFETRYRALLEFSRHHWVIGNTLFTHGAAEPEMFDIQTPRLTGKFENMALFGEVDNTKKARDDGYPNRIYTWTDRVPQGKQVIVGHDIRSTLKPLHVEGELGGDTYFMDTGSGKGGRLTSADLLFSGDNLELKVFKIH